MTDLNELKYTTDHEWIRFEGEIAVIGITDYAADQLGDVVYVDLPAVGSQAEIGKVIGEIESTKSVGELFAPVAGEVVEVNTAVTDSPELVNSDAFGEAWLVKIRFGATGDLIGREEYLASLDHE